MTPQHDFMIAAPLKADARPSIDALLASMALEPGLADPENAILPFGLKAIVAQVYKGPSWHDQKECIVLDYSDTSTIAQWVRDEIREIEPNLYLGKVYWDNDSLIHFALEFPDR